MKNRYRLVRYRAYGGMWYLHNKETGERLSLQTKDKGHALELLATHNEAVREPAFNLQKARVYMAAADPEVAMRTWADVLDAIIESKPAGSDNRRRWGIFRKDKALKSLMKAVVIETRADQFLNALRKGTMSTNVFLRRLQNFCIGMNWLPWPVLPHKLFPAVRHKSRRAITADEHKRLIERELNLERRNSYELLWYLGGAQTDIACLVAEDIDWRD